MFHCFSVTVFTDVCTTFCFSLKSYQHAIKTSPYPLIHEQSCDTDSSGGSDDDCSIQGDIETDVDLHNRPLPIPKPQTIVTQESNFWWCSIL